MAGKVIPMIKVEGVEGDVRISHLTLDQPWNNHHSFTLVCPYKEGPNSLQTLGEKYIGRKITIQLNAGIRSGQGSLTFIGLITNVRLSKHEGATVQLVIQGFSPSRLLDDGPHNRTFTEQKLSDIAKTVVGDYSQLSAKTDAELSKVLPYVTQYRETAYSFLQRLMATYGKWVYYDGEQMIVGQPPSEAEVELTFGKDLSGLDISADVVPTSFKLLGYDYISDKHYDTSSADAKVETGEGLTQQLLDASTKVYEYKPTFFEPFSITEKSQLDQQAKRRRSGQVGQLVNLFGQSSRLNLRLGDVVRVSVPAALMGLSSDVNYGSYRLLHLTHHCDGQGNYDNSFQGIPSNLKMPPNSDSRIRPPLAEPQPAEVIDNKDPEELGRIKVQFPWQKESGETTPWIRVAAAGAGGGHGAYFVPETGDQVMIGFEYHNPDRPVVLGSLYHGKVKPANAADPDNNSKIIRTRSGNQVVLSDESGKESIKIENGTNTIVLSLNGDTSITVATTGDFTLNAKNITLTAKENFTISGKKGEATFKNKGDISAKSGLTLNGGSKTEVKASEIALNAEGALSAKGGATAEVASPNTSIKGDVEVAVTAPMVKLN